MIKLSQGVRGRLVILIRMGMHPIIVRISEDVLQVGLLRWSSAKKNRLVGGLVCKIKKGSSVGNT